MSLGAALRGLVQEAGISFEGSRTDPHSVVKFLSLSFDMEYYEPQFIGVADFRKASGPLLEYTRSVNIQRGLQSGAAKDKWENKELVFVDFELEPIFGFIAKNKLTDYGLLCVIQCLLYADYEMLEIEAAYQDALDI